MSRGAAKEGAGRSIALRTIRGTSLSEHSSFAAPRLIRGVCPQPQGWRPGLNSQRRSAAPGTPSAFASPSGDPEGPGEGELAADDQCGLHSPGIGVTETVSRSKSAPAGNAEVITV